MSDRSFYESPEVVRPVHVYYTVDHRRRGGPPMKPFCLSNQDLALGLAHEAIAGPWKDAIVVVTVTNTEGRDELLEAWDNGQQLPPATTLAEVLKLTQS